MFCPHCENGCSPRANLCPKCGHPLKRIRLRRWGIIAIVAAGLLGLGMFATRKLENTGIESSDRENSLAGSGPGPAVVLVGNEERKRRIENISDRRPEGGLDASQSERAIALAEAVSKNWPQLDDLAIDEAVAYFAGDSVSEEDIVKIAFLLQSEAMELDPLVAMARRLRTVSRWAMVDPVRGTGDDSSREQTTHGAAEEEPLHQPITQPSGTPIPQQVTIRDDNPPQVVRAYVEWPVAKVAEDLYTRNAPLRDMSRRFWEVGLRTTRFEKRQILESIIEQATPHFKEIEDSVIKWRGCYLVVAKARVDKVLSGNMAVFSVGKGASTIRIVGISRDPDFQCGSLSVGEYKDFGMYMAAVNPVFQLGPAFAPPREMVERGEIVGRQYPPAASGFASESNEPHTIVGFIAKMDVGSITQDELERLAKMQLLH